MMERHVDVAILGAGSAGQSAARELRARGASFVLIEPGPNGTTCARVGCMPSKLLIAAADRAHEVRTASEFGLQTKLEVDGPAVLARVRRHRDRFVSSVLEGLEELPENARIEGRGRFVAPDTLLVDEHTRVRFGAAIVATGSKPRVPEALAAVRELVLTTDDVFELPDLPRSLAVIGTGIIGLELGQAFHRLGVRVAFFDVGLEPGPLTDPEVVEELKVVLGEELALHVGVGDLSHEACNAGVRVRWTDSVGVEHAEEFERVLAATGREPVLDGLDLAQAGVHVDRESMAIDPRTMRLGRSSIYLAGDVAGDRPLLHEASDEGRIAAVNAVDRSRDVDHARRTPLTIVFTDPQIALVGRTWSSLEGEDFAVGSVRFDDQGRAQVLGVARGLARVYAARDGRLLGAELIAPRAEHLTHLLAWAIQAQLDVRTALRMPFYHPVLEEGLRTALRELASQLGLSNADCAYGLACGPGA